MRTIRKTTKSQRTPTTEIRGLILDASKRIIEEDGYDAFTIRLLSEKADVSPASIYRHIGDKQAVINALIDDSFQTLREKLLRVTTEDPLQRLYDAGVVYRGHAKASVVPEKLRTLDHGRPWSDDQFASTRLSSNRDMSR